MTARLILLALSIQFTLSIPPGFSQTRVVVALPSTSVNQAAFHLARDAGYFRDEGLDLITPTIRPNIAIAGLLNGDVDYTLAGDSAAFAAMNGVAVRHIGCINRYQTFQFIVSPKIDSAAQLRGKTVAVTSVASTTGVVTQLVLRHLGLGADAEVRLISTETTGNALLTLQADRAAAALLSPPFDVQAQQLGYRSLLTIGDIIPMPPTCFGAAAKKLIEQPEQVKGLLRASLKGLRLVLNDRERTIAVIMRQFKLTRTFAESVYKTHRGAFETDGLPTAQQLDFLINQGKAQAKLTREIKPEDFTDYRLLQEVRRESR
jgi:ABC-type nitrate/sulfonate/bicarbonate transport system substrate-binding protein